MKFSPVRLFVSHRNWHGHSLEISKAAATGATASYILRYERHEVLDACHRTSGRQEHMIIQRAGPKRDTILNLRVTAWQPPSQQAIRMWKQRKRYPGIVGSIKQLMNTKSPKPHSYLKEDGTELGKCFLNPLLKSAMVKQDEM